jgi:hypothetical protein
MAVLERGRRFLNLLHGCADLDTLASRACVDAD